MWGGDGSFNNNNNGSSSSYNHNNNNNNNNNNNSSKIPGNINIHELQKIHETLLSTAHLLRRVLSIKYKPSLPPKVHGLDADVERENQSQLH